MASDPASPSDDINRLPRPKIKKMHWPFPVIWIVPIGAAILTGWFWHKHHQEAGLEVAIEFPDGSGIEPGQTQVQIHGVPIGHVQSMTLSDDHAHAIAHVRLATSAGYVARKGTRFWLVHPELSLESISGLNTIISGPYIEALPGEGDESHYFTGTLEVPKNLGSGVHFTLHASTLGSVTADAPVTYLGVAVGRVEDVRLAQTGDNVEVVIFIHDRYAPLVRTSSFFYEVKAADIKGGLFTGVKVKLDSLKSILTGGISFATPEKNVAAQAPPDSEFVLHSQPEDAWLKWHPRIPLPSAEMLPAPQSSGGSGKTALPVPKKE